jgi:hypothetical protein
MPLRSLRAGRRGDARGAEAAGALRRRRRRRRRRRPLDSSIRLLRQVQSRSE